MWIKGAMRHAEMVEKRWDIIKGTINWLVATVVWVLTSGCMVSHGWDWFVVPLGVSAVSFWQACGLVAIFQVGTMNAAVTAHESVPDKKYHRYIRSRADITWLKVSMLWMSYIVIILCYYLM